MSPKEPMSRRAWLRGEFLRDEKEPVRAEGKRTAKHLGNRPAATESRSLDAPPRLNPVEIDLPPVIEAMLSVEETESLFEDIKCCATNVEIVQWGGDRSRSERTAEILDHARSELRAGRVKTLQLRYEWEGKKWIDTLTGTPEGTRLVRIAHQLS